MNFEPEFNGQVSGGRIAVLCDGKLEWRDFWVDNRGAMPSMLVPVLAANERAECLPGGGWVVIRMPEGR